VATASRGTNYLYYTINPLKVNRKFIFWIVALSQLKLYGQTFCGIETALPGLGYMDITEKYLLGEDGALFLLEQIMNGLRYVK
jgi:hypothetical protein